LGDRRSIANSLNNLGNVAYYQGDYEAARTLLKESLALKRDLGDPIIAFTLEGLAKLGVAVREPLHAARLWGAAERLREETGSPTEQISRPEYEQQVTAARLAVGNVAAFDAAWAEGRAMTMGQALAYALEPESLSPTH
jgi:tetratricopeptide (TPR) repeat protein